MSVRYPTVPSGVAKRKAALSAQSWLVGSSAASTHPSSTVLPSPAVRSRGSIPARRQASWRAVPGVVRMGV